MVVISDTSPLNYLVLIGEISLLPRLFGRVLVPREVIEALERSAPTGPVSRWLASQPTWLTTVDVRFTRVQSLDLGETAAITLAKQFPGEALLVIDDFLGRRAALAAGLEATGTIGVLHRLQPAAGLICRMRFAACRPPTFGSREHCWSRYCGRRHLDQANAFGFCHPISSPCHKLSPTTSTANG